jgi:hypothetical protein
MDKRHFLILCAALFSVGGMSCAHAKDGDGNNSGGGGSNSGSGGESGNGDGGGNGRGRGRGGDDGDNDDDNYDDDDNDDAGADDNNQLENTVADKVNRGELRPLAKVLKAALDHTPGKVFSVSLRLREQTYIYRIKILDKDGRKHDLLIDANTLDVVEVK